MKRLQVAEEDRRTVAEWYDRWGGFVADVNFKPVRTMFAEDVIAFGSKVEVMTSQPQLEAKQWRSVWPSIEDYRFDISTLEVITSPDRLMAMGALIFRSTGLHPDGTKFERDGRRLRASLRQAHCAQPPRRAGPRQRHGHALRRADGGLAHPGHGRPAGHRISRPGARSLCRPRHAGEAVREILGAGRAPQGPS